MPDRRLIALFALAVAAVAAATGGTAIGAGTPDAGQRPRAVTSQTAQSQVYGRFRDASISLGAAQTDVLKVTVPAGSYMILAKANVLQRQFDPATCRVIAGADFDETRIQYRENTGFVTSSFTLTVLHASPTSFTARLRCGDADPDDAGELSSMKLTALRVGSISNLPG